MHSTSKAHEVSQKLRLAAQTPGKPSVPPPGDGRYSLLGQPFQYNLSICPPLLHGQSAYTVHQVSVSPGGLGRRGLLLTQAPASEPSPQPAGQPGRTAQREWTEWEEPPPGSCGHSSHPPRARSGGPLFLTGHSLASLTAW